MLAITETGAGIQPQYRYEDLSPSDGVSNFTIEDVRLVKQFKIVEGKQVNFSKSRLRVPIIVRSSGGSRYNRLYVMTPALIGRITLQTQSGKTICDVRDVARAMRILWSHEVTQSQLDQLPDGQGYAPCAILQRNNEPLYDPVNSILDVQVNSTAEVPNPNTSGTDIDITNDTSNSEINWVYSQRCLRPDDLTVSRAYSEICYFMRGDAGSDTPFLYVDMPLGLLLGTFFSKDIDCILNEQWNLTVEFNDQTKIGWSGDDPDVPSSDAQALNDWIDVESLSLTIASQTNPRYRQAVADKVSSPDGFTTIIPQYHMFTAPHAAGEQKIMDMQVSAVHGMNLVRVYATLWNAVEVANTAYEIGNLDVNGDIIHTTRYNTYMDGVKEHYADIDCNTYKDFVLITPKLRGTVIQDYQQHMYNWVHVSDYSGNEMLWQDYSDEPRGIDLQKAHRWEFRGEGPQTNYTVRCLCITQRKFIMQGNNVNVI